MPIDRKPGWSRGAEKLAGLVVCPVLLISGCTVSTNAMRKRRDCLMLIETVEARMDRIEISRDVLDVYEECKDDLGESDNIQASGGVRGTSQ